ncbi:MAG: peptidase-C39 like family protein [Gammaproteobacteria bacterium]|jgi:hypothetical protein|nr:peptidase-C39 like family protein [Gammaproteobacteria bacterium]
MIPIKILSQPDDTTCGPTSLHAVYNHYHDPISLEQVIREIIYLETGGTLEVLLGCHALRRGYQATIYTYNLNIFDPVWFSVKKTDMVDKLERQLAAKGGEKLRIATEAYIEFIGLGGKILFKDLTPSLLNGFFKQGKPVLTGLSATYLYQSSREYTGPSNKTVYDDIGGYPCGHFVVLCGYDEEHRLVVVADPYAANPVSKNNYYSVKASRLINSIMLGIATHDANLLIIEPYAAGN